MAIGQRRGGCAARRAAVVRGHWRVQRARRPSCSTEDWCRGRLRHQLCLWRSSVGYRYHRCRPLPASRWRSPRRSRTPSRRCCTCRWRWRWRARAQTRALSPAPGCTPRMGRLVAQLGDSRCTRRSSDSETGAEWAAQRARAAAAAAAGARVWTTSAPLQVPGTWAATRPEQPRLRQGTGAVAGAEAARTSVDSPAAAAACCRARRTSAPRSTEGSSTWQDARTAIYRNWYILIQKFNVFKPES